jgi:hypothetical protein
MSIASTDHRVDLSGGGCQTSLFAGERHRQVQLVGRNCGFHSGLLRGNNIVGMEFSVAVKPW